jgi:SAM-dependent methyltransferase
MSGTYEQVAEYYDLMAVERWRQLGPVAGSTPSNVASSAGPLLDLGAGTGLMTVALADALPDASIVAVEPSRAMRTALIARLVTRGELPGRITVVPAPFSEAVMPPRLCGAVALGMLGHLTHDERRTLWRALAERLMPGAPAAIEIQPPDRPVAVPRARFTRIRLGEHEYEGWAQAEPIGRDRLRWTMTYRTLRGEQVVDERVAASEFLTLDAGAMAAEARAAGLIHERDIEGLLILRAPAR